MIITVECTHSTAKLWNVHIQWLFAVECVHSTRWTDVSATDVSA